MSSKSHWSDRNQSHSQSQPAASGHFPAMRQGMGFNLIPAIPVCMLVCQSLCIAAAFPKSYAARYVRVAYVPFQLTLSSSNDPWRLM